MQIRSYSVPVISSNVIKSMRMEALKGEKKDKGIDGFVRK